jgi:hypothetical protein
MLLSTRTGRRGELPSNWRKRHRLTLYDAAYLKLALRRGPPRVSLGEEQPRGGICPLIVALHGAVPPPLRDRAWSTSVGAVSGSPRGLPRRFAKSTKGTLRFRGTGKVNGVDCLTQSRRPGILVSDVPRLLAGLVRLPKFASSPDVRRNLRVRWCVRESDSYQRSLQRGLVWQHPAPPVAMTLDPSMDADFALSNGLLGWPA